MNKSLCFYLLLLLFAMTSLASCQTARETTTYPQSTWIAPPSCLEGEEQWWHIFTYNITTGAYEQLTEGTVRDVMPTFSPDGKRIAFIRNASTIQVLDMADQKTITIAEHAGGYEDIQWSPNGQQFAFVASWSGMPHVYLMQSDGAQVRRLTQQEAPETSPTWLPDSQRLAFLAPSNYISGTIAVYTATTDSTSANEVLSRFCQSQNNGSCPSFSFVTWSSVDEMFATVTESYGWSVVPAPEKYPTILDQQASNSIVVLEHDVPKAVGWSIVGRFESLSWSPDGKQIAYYDNCACGFESIGLIDLSTGERQDLLVIDFLGHAIADPTWSSDGKLLAYSQASCVR
jgi:Tol biopolymer transport system component